MTTPHDDNSEGPGGLSGTLDRGSVFHTRGHQGTNDNSEGPGGLSGTLDRGSVFHTGGHHSPGATVFHGAAATRTVVGTDSGRGATGVTHDQAIGQHGAFNGGQLEHHDQTPHHQDHTTHESSHEDAHAGSHGVHGDDGGHGLMHHFGHHG
ncbi:MAG TPA: hypothetical protein VGH76_26050 [Actinomycetospora sp.]|uniref:hypothetical protein n=1 Tax=Actinomycetospora sp. TaxID=1872135 RepID=UPI002F4117C9